MGISFPSLNECHAFNQFRLDSEQIMSISVTRISFLMFRL